MDWVKRKLLSRKFLMAVGAVIAAFGGTISWDQAVAIVMAWIASEGVADAVATWKK